MFEAMKQFKLLPLLIGTLLILIVGSATAATQAVQPQKESAFVRQTSRLLQTRYPNVAATKAGYVKMRELDKDNTIIYTNFDYKLISIDRPNFLWYDRNGRLVGVDYEFPKSAYPAPPKRFPVLVSRWVTIGEHVHFAYALNGKTVRHGGPASPGLRRDPISLSALQKAKLVPAGAHLLWATYHPTCWDLGFWTVTNPAGPFAEHNALVK